MASLLETVKENKPLACKAFIAGSLIGIVLNALPAAIDGLSQPQRNQTSTFQSSHESEPIPPTY